MANNFEAFAKAETKAPDITKMSRQQLSAYVDSHILTVVMAKNKNVDYPHAWEQFKQEHPAIMQALAEAKRQSRYSKVNSKEVDDGK